MRHPESCLAASLQRAPLEEEVEGIDARRCLIPLLSAVNFPTFLDTSSTPTLTPDSVPPELSFG